MATTPHERAAARERGARREVMAKLARARAERNHEERRDGDVLRTPSPPARAVRGNIAAIRESRGERPLGVVLAARTSRFLERRWHGCGAALSAIVR